MCMKDTNNFKLADGLPEFLNFLKQSKVPISIATGCSINNVKFYLKHLNLDKWFDLNNIVYEDGTFPGKPKRIITNSGMDASTLDLRMRTGCDRADIYEKQHN